MSVEQLIEEFEKLNEHEREAFLLGVGVAPISHYEETPEFIAAVEEGIRSADEGPMIPIEKMIEEVESWRTKSA